MANFTKQLQEAGKIKMQNRFLSMQVQDLEVSENKLRSELARVSTIHTMSQLLGETPMGEPEPKKSRGDSVDDF